MVGNPSRATGLGRERRDYSGEYRMESEQRGSPTLTSNHKAKDAMAGRV